MHFICILNKKPYLCTHKTITSRSGAVGSHIPLFIGITDAVEATQKCGRKICFHTVSQTEILTHKKLT